MALDAATSRSRASSLPSPEASAAILLPSAGSDPDSGGSPARGKLLPASSPPRRTWNRPRPSHSLHPWAPSARMPIPNSYEPHQIPAYRTAASSPPPPHMGCRHSQPSRAPHTLRSAWILQGAVGLTTMTGLASAPPKASVLQ